jgi:hypothetical protein
MAVTVDRAGVLVQVALEHDQLLAHHRGVVMRDFEQRVVAELCAHAGRPADDLATTAGVAAILAAFRAAVHAWILHGAHDDFATWLEGALDGALDAVTSVSPRATIAR